MPTPLYECTDFRDFDPSTGKFPHATGPLAVAAAWPAGTAINFSANNAAASGMWPVASPTITISGTPTVLPNVLDLSSDGTSYVGPNEFFAALHDSLPVGARVNYTFQADLLDPDLSGLYLAGYWEACTNDSPLEHLAPAWNVGEPHTDYPPFGALSGAYRSLAFTVPEGSASISFKYFPPTWSGPTAWEARSAYLIAFSIIDISDILLTPDTGLAPLSVTLSGNYEMDAGTGGGGGS